jgi:hypothetical protein
MVPSIDLLWLNDVDSRYIHSSAKSEAETRSANRGVNEKVLFIPHFRKEPSKLGIVGCAVFDNTMRSQLLQEFSVNSPEMKRDRPSFPKTPFGLLNDRSGQVANEKAHDVARGTLTEVRSKRDEKQGNHDGKTQVWLKVGRDMPPAVEPLRPRAAIQFPS